MTPHPRFLMLLAALVCLAPGAPAGQRPAVMVVGAFSNMRHTEEHPYGYAAHLWRHGDRLFGLLLVAEGPQGDTPAGFLEDVSFDPRSGRLRFRAKLTTGMALIGGTEQPSRDLFEFTGTLGKSALAGIVKRFDRLRPADAPQQLRVRLRKSAQGAAAPS